MNSPGLAVNSPFLLPHQLTGCWMLNDGVDVVVSAAFFVSCVITNGVIEVFAGTVGSALPKGIKVKMTDHSKAIIVAIAAMPPQAESRNTKSK